MSTDTGFAGAGTPVEVGQIEEALRQEWRAEAARATEASESLAARTNVLNLIVHGSSPGEIAQVSEAIERLGCSTRRGRFSCSPSRAARSRRWRRGSTRTSRRCRGVTGDSSLSR